MANKLISTEPEPNEIVWVQYRNEDHVTTHVITSNKLRTEYYLYEIKNDTWKKIKKADSPVELEPLIPFYDDPAEDSSNA